MNNYNPKEFIAALSKKFEKDTVPSCPYCGGNKFTTTESFASILIGKELKSITIGPSVPAGMLICEKCGHIEFFAMGVLGLLNEEEGNNNG